MDNVLRNILTKPLPEVTETASMESAAESNTEPNEPTYSESRLEEAELIINLSARRRTLSNPTLTQVNTSIAGPITFSPSVQETGTTVSISETLSNSKLGDSTSSMEVHTESEVIDTISGNENDLLLADNTVAVMGEVTSSNSEVLPEHSESVSITEGSVALDEMNGNNVIIISVVDKDGEEVTASNNVIRLSAEGEVIQEHQRSDDGAESPLPVPTNILINQHNTLLSEDQEEPEITIERKKVHHCIVCNAEFKSIMDLFRHRVEHNESMKSQFKCEVTPACKLTFEDPLELEKHKLTHAEQRLFKCSICQDTFSLLHNYKCHLRIHNNQGPYVCNMCYRVFDKKAQFISHMDDHEFASLNPYRHRLQCSVCDKIFSDSAKLRRHILIHTGKKEYKCNVCGREFLERNKLTRHMLSHTGKRDYHCTICNKSFSLKHNLTIHMRIHENLRPYQCLVCKRTFIQKIVLQRHLRIHQDYLMEQSQRFSEKYVN